MEEGFSSKANGQRTTFLQSFNLPRRSLFLRIHFLAHLDKFVAPTDKFSRKKFKFFRKSTFTQNRIFRGIKPFVRIVLHFLSFGENLNDYLGEYPQKIDLNHLKIQFWVKVNLRKMNSNFFRENLLAGAISLSRCAFKRI